MEQIENKGTAAVDENAVEVLRKLIESVGNNDDLKRKLTETFAALTGQKEETPELTVSGPEDVKPENGEIDDDEIDDDDDEEECSGTFNDDAVAGMVIGFVAGAALIGGGILLHKLIAKTCL